jgi:inner membrane protein
MATPVGHALAGYAVYRVNAEQRGERGTLLWVCVVLAIVPDLDFIPGMLMGQPDRYHQGISHSIGVALVVSFGVALAHSAGKGTVMADWGRFFCAYASHLVIDTLAPDRRPPYGVPLWWPLSDEYYLAPFALFQGVRHSRGAFTTPGEWLTAVLDPGNLRAVGREILVLLPVVLLICLVQHFRGPRTTGR